MSEQIQQMLCAPGAPFEFTSLEKGGQQLRVFKQAAPCLSHLYDGLLNSKESDLAVYDGRRLSYASAYTQAASLANVLSESYAIGVGSRVAIVMRNSPEWIVSFIAITSLGAVAALVNSRGANDEIEYSVRTTECDLLILDQKIEASLNNSRSLHEHDKRIVFDLAGSFIGTRSDGEALAVKPSASLPRVEVDTDEVALILFTSGTTGRPKGALLSHRGVANALKANEFSGAIIGASMAQKYGIDLATLAANQPQACTLLMFPLFHVSGCYSVFLANMLRGGKIAMLSRWSAEAALQCINDEKVTMFTGVPTMYWDMLGSADIDSYDLSSLTSLSVAGQATPESLLQRIKASFPSAMMGSGYGMTETNGVISMIIGEEFSAAPDSVGRPLAISEIRIDDGAGGSASANDSGEICVRGAAIMLGYDKQPEANAKCFKDGWFHTGDVGYIDDDGKLFIVDRLTEMVITGGENVYCAEVERVLNQAQDVVEVCTFGLPDDRLGEKLIALVRVGEGSEQNSQSLNDYCASSLASYKVPAEIHLLEHGLERNATGKVLKEKAKAIYQELIS